jgi:hypothetical protein
MQERKYRAVTKTGKIVEFYASADPDAVIRENMEYGCGCGKQHGKMSCSERFVSVEEVKI